MAHSRLLSRERPCVGRRCGRWGDGRCRARLIFSRDVICGQWRCAGVLLAGDYMEVRGDRLIRLIGVLCEAYLVFAGMTKRRNLFVHMDAPSAYGNAIDRDVDLSIVDAPSYPVPVFCAPDRRQLTFALILAVPANQRALAGVQRLAAGCKPAAAVIKPGRPCKERVFLCGRARRRHRWRAADFVGVSPTACKCS